MTKPETKRQQGIRYARTQIEAGVTLVRIAKDLKISRRTLHRWLTQK